MSLPPMSSPKWDKDTPADLAARDMRMRKAQWYIDRRISCYAGGYPDSEARFLSVEEYCEYLEGLLSP